MSNLTWQQEITDWWHVSSRVPMKPIIKSVAYANSIGREPFFLSAGINNESSVTITFSSEGTKLNCIKETTENAVLSKITSLQNYSITGVLYTLTFGNESYADMALISFGTNGDIKKILKSNVNYYIVDFYATFSQFYGS